MMTHLSHKLHPASRPDLTKKRIGAHLSRSTPLPIMTFEDNSFLKGFSNKGRMANHMERFPIQLLKDDHTALYGCRAFLGEG